MKLISANIKCNPTMTQRRVVHDVNRVSQLGGVILWQEIAIPRYRDAVAALQGFDHNSLQHECPISWKDKYWELVPGLHGAELMHKGRSHVTPNRYVTWVGLQRKGRDVSPVIVMNTHMISGAFSNHYPSTKKWRRARWHEHFKKQKEIVLDFNRKGFTVLGGGDLNRTAVPKFAPHQRWLAVGGIDHIWCLEAPHGAKVRLHESHAYAGGMYTDHQPRIAELFLS